MLVPSELSLPFKISKQSFELMSHLHHALYVPRSSSQGLGRTVSSSPSFLGTGCGPPHNHSPIGSLDLSFLTPVRPALTHWPSFCLVRPAPVSKLTLSRSTYSST
jgi:hypothetical protein